MSSEPKLSIVKYQLEQSRDEQTMGVTQENFVKVYE